MLNTIVHYVDDIPTQIYHGILFWTNRNAGEFLFATQDNGKATEFWCKTDWWTTCDYMDSVQTTNINEEILCTK